MTLGHPTPTAVADSQWSEPHLEAFATDARFAGSSVTVAGLAALNGQLLVLAVYEVVNPDLSCWGRGLWGRAGVTTCPLFSPGRGVMFTVCCRRGEYCHHPSMANGVF